ncbi:hypothetical protein EXIGLDRAFT_837740 [Exidia glandulosa HHB12029]|uniref:Uncharacterized protein n=1 Tax=Exidia glandulosa HHB12029 TaxID=1314781 RepID=A0A165GGN2_EXIGL|nr:hypothetical protein EXIGLDRAFT_837740 [Exidia glandulosa HHB12029]
MAPPIPPPSAGTVKFSHRLLKTAVENPYDTFTAPQFDSWVGDLTSSIRAALNNKSRGKARDPREGAGIAGLRRELEWSRSSDSLDVDLDDAPNLNGHHARSEEPADANGSPFVLTPLSGVAELDPEHGDPAQQDEPAAEEEDEEELGPEDDTFYGRSRPDDTADDAGDEYLDFDDIYPTKGVVRPETGVSPPWRIEEDSGPAEERPPVAQGGFFEDDDEADQYASGEYAQVYEYGDPYDEAYDEQYDEEESKPSAAQEVFEIEDDDDEPQQKPVSYALDDEEEEEEGDDELFDDDKENVAVADYPRPSHLQSIFSTQAPTSSLRDGSGTPQSSSAASTPVPSPSKRPAAAEIITIDDDDDEDLPALPSAPTHTAAPFAQNTQTEIDLFSLSEGYTHPHPLDFDVTSSSIGVDNLNTEYPDGADLESAMASLADGTMLSLDPTMFTPVPIDEFAPVTTMEEVESLLAGGDDVLGAVGAPEMTDVEKAATSDVASDAATQVALPAHDVSSQQYEELVDAIAKDEDTEADVEEKDYRFSEAPSELTHKAEEIVVLDEDPPTLQEPAAELDDAVEVVESSPPTAAAAAAIEPEDVTVTDVDADVEQPSAQTTVEDKVEPDALFMHQGEHLHMALPGERMKEEPDKRLSPPPPAHEPHLPVEPAHEHAHVPFHFMVRGEQEGGRKDAEEEPKKHEAVPLPLSGVPDDEVEKSPVALEISTEEAGNMSVEEKKALFERGDVDPFSLMGDDSLVAPGAVESGEITPLEGEEEDVEADADASGEEDETVPTEAVVLTSASTSDADVAMEISQPAVEDPVVEFSVTEEAATLSQNASEPASADFADFDLPELQESMTAEGATYTDPELVAAVSAEETQPASQTLEDDAGLSLVMDAPSTLDTQEIQADDTSSTPTQADARSPQLEFDTLPPAMTDILGLPSPLDAGPSSATTPVAETEEATPSPGDDGASKTPSKSRRAPRVARPVLPTRSSTRLARTASQTTDMTPPTTRGRPPNSARSEASSVSTSSVADGASSRASSVASTSQRGRRRQREMDTSAPASRESTVQPTSRKAKGKGTKRKRDNEDEAGSNANGVTAPPQEDQPDQHIESGPPRPPLLRTQTYRHYHGKRNGAAADAGPTWASLKWNSILQPTLAFLRLKPGEGGASSSTAVLEQTTTPLPEPEKAPAASDAPQDVASAPAEPTATPADADAVTSAIEALPEPEVVVPHIEDVVTNGESSTAALADPTAQQPSTGSTPLPVLRLNTSLKLDTLPSAFNSPSLQSPAIPSVPPPTPAVATSSSHARRPSFMIQDSFIPESGHMTRSNCRFHKISIPAAPGSDDVVQFLAPACSITNLELMKQEGIVDCGYATDIDHSRTIIDLEVVSNDVLHALRRLVGLEMLREGEVGFVIPEGETVESLRERMPDTSDSIFHQIRKPNKSKEDSKSESGAPHKKRKRAPSQAPSHASTLTDLSDEEGDKLDTPASRTRSRVDASSPLSPLSSPAESRRRKRTRLDDEDEHEEYKPSEVDHAIEAEDDEEDYSVLTSAPRSKKRSRNKTSGTTPAGSEAAPSPAAPPEGETDVNHADAASAPSSKAQKKAPRRKSRKRKSGVVDPAFKPAPGDATDSGDEELEAAESKAAPKGKRGKKRAAGEETPGGGAADDNAAPSAKKRRTASIASVPS